MGRLDFPHGAGTRNCRHGHASRERGQPIQSGRNCAGVGCFVDSCRTCAACREGLEQYCETGMVLTYSGRDKGGRPTQGGYSAQIVVDESYVLRIPSALSPAGAAPLLCAGITTYSPLRHWGVGKVSQTCGGGIGWTGPHGCEDRQGDRNRRNSAEHIGEKAKRCRAVRCHGVRPYLTTRDIYAPTASF